MSAEKPIFYKGMPREAFEKALEAYGHDNEFPGALFRGGPKSYVGAVLTVTATLYFREGYAKEKRAAICECFDEYVAVAGDKLTWVQSDDNDPLSKPTPYAKAKPLDQWVKKLDEDDRLSFIYTSGKTYQDGSAYTFEIETRRKWAVDRDLKSGSSKGVFDVVHFALPASEIMKDLTVFQRLMVSFARRLGAYHGYAGFGMQLSHPWRLDDEPTEAYASQKWKGIDIGDAYLDARYLSNDRIKTTSWLTVVGRPILDQLPVNTIRSELPPGWFALYDYGDGIIIQAGNGPDPVMVSRDPMPASYVLPSMLLKPYRADGIIGHANVNGSRPLIAGQDATRIWQARFDVPEDQLIEYKRKLTYSPPLDPKFVYQDALLK